MIKRLASTFIALATAVGLCAHCARGGPGGPCLRGKHHYLRPQRLRFRSGHAGRPTFSARRNDIFKKMESNQFGPERYALLFKPGKYNVDFNVGFYTHVAGLGRNPDDVQIDGALTVNAKWADGKALNNFWRTLENLAIIPSSDVPWKNNKGITRIAVSQASPLRRLHVKGELQLFDWGSKGNVGYASGGFLADSVVDGKLVPASQQQWLSRNSKWGNWNNAVWNMVFVGCENTPPATFPDPPYTIVDKTPVIREKPYLYVDGAGKYCVFVPALETNTRGVTWASGPTHGHLRSPSISSTSPSLRRPAPPNSTPPWPRANTSFSRRASTSLTTR